MDFYLTKGEEKSEVCLKSAFRVCWDCLSGLTKCSLRAFPQDQLGCCEALIQAPGGSLVLAPHIYSGPGLQLGTFICEPVS